MMKGLQLLRATRCLSSSKGPRQPVLGLLSGSTREGSVNTKLVKAAGRLLAARGAEVKFLDLGAYDLPLYSQALEAAPPAAVRELKAAFASCDGLAVASPEYNGLMTPLLLNAYTWASRLDEGMTPYGSFKRQILLLGASPGGLGGMRALRPHREVLTNLGATVLPEQVALGQAFGAFDDAGDLKNEPQAKMLEVACSAFYHSCLQAANHQLACDLIKSAKPVGAEGHI